MPSFFGVVSTPADNGTNATTTITLTPPASMVTGDLVVVYCTQRGTTAWSVGLDGGQSWSAIGNNTGTATVSLNTFWTRFNGTWSVNPRFDNAGGTNTTAIMVVFRNTAFPNGYWGVEQPQTTNAAAAATITVTGVTPTNDNNVTIASWSTADDNTWGTLTGTGWVKTSLAAQYRNLAGNDSSTTLAYQIQTTAAPTNNVSQTQLTLGNDATAWRRLTFYESEFPLDTSFDPMGMLGIFGL